MKLLTEKIVNTDKFAGRVDIITGIDDFESPVEYNDEWHTYKLDGKFLPSVTQILDDGSFDHIKDEPFFIYACNKGTMVHDEIEQWLLTKNKGFTAELYEFIRLFNDNQDLFNSKAVWDVKTSTILNKKKTKEQLQMYCEGIEYLTKEKIEHMFAIHLPKNGHGQIVRLQNQNLKNVKLEQGSIDIKEINKKIGEII